MELLSLAGWLATFIYVHLALTVLNKNRRAPANIVGAMLFACFALWSAGQAVLQDPRTSRDTLTIVGRISGIGWTLFPVLTVVLYLLIAGYTRVLSSRLFRTAVVVLPVLFLVPHLMGLYYADHIHTSVGWLVGWSHSPLTYAFLLYITLTALTGYLILFSMMIHPSGKARARQASVLFYTSVVTLVLGVLTEMLFPLMQVSSVPRLGHITSLIWAAGVYYAVSRLQLFDVGPSIAADLIIERMSDALLLVDSRGTILSANPAATRLLRMGRGSLVGRPVSDVLSDSNGDSAAINTLLGRATSVDTTAGLEANLVRADGTTVPIDLNVTATGTLAGNEKGYILLGRDLSERREVEAEREQVQHQLAESQKMEALGRLAGGIAHDFNNMLGAIQGYADMLRRKYRDSEPTVYRYADRVSQAARRSAEMTAQLLAFARRGRHEQSAIDVHALIREVVGLLEHSLDKRIKIVLSFDATAATVIGDRTLLQNAIMNLAVNARDAMPEGGTLTFATTLDTIHRTGQKVADGLLEEGAYVRITVSDTGTGMPAETKACAFEPFFSTKAKGKGTGLGLASVYGTVKAHEGHIDLESTEGSGTTLTILLPIARHEMPQASARTEDIRRGSGLVMVVDDEELVRDMATEMLTGLGYEVIACRDGRSAIDTYRLKSDAIAAVIIDLVMPDVSGYDCFLALREINPEVRAIIASGYAVDGEAQRALDEGALEFLHKPFGIGRLSQAVASAVMQ